MKKRFLILTSIYCESWCFMFSTSIFGVFFLFAIDVMISHFLCFFSHLSFYSQSETANLSIRTSSLRLNIVLCFGTVLAITGILPGRH